MEWWLAYAAIGAAVGFFAGLLGIGGGAVTVPLLVMVFAAQGMPKDHLVHLAVGTGMAVVLVTSVSSVWAHAGRGAVRWEVARAMTPGILLGGLVGSGLAGQVSTRLLGMLFCIITYAAAANILFERKPKASRQLPGAAGLSLVGFGISTISALAALGGAFLTTPFMLWCNVRMIDAIGTAAVVGFPIALAGSAGYVASGWSQAGLPPMSLGYIYLPALLGVSLASVACAPLGAALAHRLQTRQLKRVFALLLFGLATKMAVSLW
jgi:uncharacterized membrane protein YfcA